MPARLTARDFETADQHSQGANPRPDDAARRVPVVLAQTPPFSLGDATFDPPARQVTFGDGETERLEPRVMEVLVALHRGGGAVVSRDDLLAACWRGLIVGEDAIQRVIQRLRKVAARAATFRIDTISKAGYCLVELADLREGARGDAPTVAVLPFANRSGLPEDEALALGMAEDMIDALSQGVNLRVIALSATLRFRDKPIADFPATGLRLGVRYFLGGNVRRNGDALVVTAQLVEAASSEVLWSQRFERHLDQFAQLQGDLVTEVANTLGATIYKLEMDRALRKPANLTAWECTARAMAAIREYDAASLSRAITESQRAVEIAPDYGLARAIHALTIAGAYLSFELHDPVREREIQQHIDRAFALDPDHVGVLAAIASASAYLSRPTDGLPRALRAIRLRPAHGLGHYAAGICSLMLDLEREAIVHLDNFLVAEPESHLHYITFAWRGISHVRLREFEAARADFAESFALYPGNFIARLMLTCIDHADGREDLALQHITTARELEPGATLSLYHARIARFLMGSPLLQKMQAALDELWPLSEQG